MKPLLDTILRHIAQAETTAENDPQYIELLDRVIDEAKARRMAARMRMCAASEGKAPAGPVVEDKAADAPPRQFARHDRVWTKEGYIGHVAGYDKKGRVVVNVVWQACEYAEGDLKPFHTSATEESL